jgi:hypothetical protein
MSYSVAVPTAPSFPGAVQFTLKRVGVASVTARSVTAAGGSTLESVVRLTMLESSDQLEASSRVLIAKKYRVAGVRVVTAKISSKPEIAGGG